jgi:hypothetical protein
VLVVVHLKKKGGVSPLRCSGLRRCCASSAVATLSAVLAVVHLLVTLYPAIMATGVAGVLHELHSDQILKLLQGPQQSAVHRFMKRRV